MPVKPIPEGYHSVTPYLVGHDIGKLIDFLKRAFGAEETHPPMKRPDGAIMHAEVTIGDSKIMMGEAEPKPCVFYHYTANCDAVHQRALQAGGTSVAEPTDQFYGDRHAAVMDPCGNVWWVATHIEDVPAEEMKKRAEAHAKPKT
ncbi:MAG TPA: VOC family protein [Isosphaeraceae bacterium]|jgi:uncharacterized glyoxalase superfamily protein PhnB|nr:VOC family protein [Isosphaeraceae bacterium]